MTDRLINWCRRHPAAAGILYWCVYLTCFFLVEKAVTAPRFLIHCGLDDRIPFVPQAVVFYVLWFPYIAFTLLSFLLHAPRREYWRLLVSLMISMMMTLLFYVLVPNGVQLRPETIEGNDVFTWGVRMIWAADTPANVCPSIHVFVSVLIDMAWSRSALTKGRPHLRAVSHAADFLICASTVLLKQHSIIDVCFGAVTAVVMNAISERMFSGPNGKGKATAKPAPL